MFEIIRKRLTDKSSTGGMYCDGEYMCETLEDKTREGPKVPGATAIPCGTYEIVIDPSQRFKKLMPHILRVPDFSGVRIHKGNDAGDTEGCPLVGMQSGPDRVWDCQPAYDKFFKLLWEHLETGQKQYIKVSVAVDVEDLRTTKG